MGSALLGTLTLDAGSGQQVAVGPCTGNTSVDCIDFDYTGGTTTLGTTASPLIATGTVDGTGDSAIFTIGNNGGYMGDAQGNNVTVHDLNSATPPAGEPAGSSVTLSNFINFAPSEPWSIELTMVDLGGETGSCAALPVQNGQTCTPPGTPFNENNYACSGSSCEVSVTFAFNGIANDGSGNMSNVAGTFSTTFSGTNFQTINSDISGGYDVVTSDSGTLVFSATSSVPEPMSSALVGAGLLIIGLVNRKRLLKP